MLPTQPLVSVITPLRASGVRFISEPDTGQTNAINVGRLLSEPQLIELNLDPRAVVVGARAEAAVMSASLRGLRHLASLEVWRYPETRRRLAVAVRFAILAL